MRDFIVGVLALNEFLNLGALADSAAQIVELSTTDFTASYYFYLSNVGGMEREGLFNTNTVGNSAYGKGLGDAAAVLSDNGAFKHLNSLSVTLFDLVVNTNSVTDVELGHRFLQLLVSKSLNKIHGFLAPLYKIRSVRAEHLAEDRSGYLNNTRIITEIKKKIKGYGQVYELVTNFFFLFYSKAIVKLFVIKYNII